MKTGGHPDDLDVDSGEDSMSVLTELPDERDEESYRQREVAAAE